MSRLVKGMILLWITCALMTVVGLLGINGNLPGLSQVLKESAYFDWILQVLEIGGILTTGGLIVMFFIILFQGSNAYAVVRREEGGRLELERTFFERLVMISLAPYTIIHQPYVKVIIGRAKEGPEALSIVVDGDLDEDINPDDFVDNLRKEIGQNIRQAIDVEVSDISFRFRPLAKDPSVRRLN